MLSGAKGVGGAPDAPCGVPSSGCRDWLRIVPPSRPDPVHSTVRL